MTDAEAATPPNPARWLVEACLLGAGGGLVCCFLNELLLGIVTGEFGFLVLGAVFLALLVVAALIAFAIWVLRSAEDRLAASPRAARRTATAVCVLGWLPWFAPDEARLGLTMRLALGPALVVGAFWFAAVAALAIDARSVRRTAAAALAVLALAWLPVRDAVVGFAADSALSHRGIPRSMALIASWPDYLPGHYLRIGGEVRLQYDLNVPMPCPDCGSSGVLTVGPAAADPCDLPMALADGASVETPPNCHEVDPGTWARDSSDGCDVIQTRGDFSVRIYEDDCPGSSQLVHILATVRPADAADILHQT